MVKGVTCVIWEAKLCGFTIQCQGKRQCISPSNETKSLSNSVNEDRHASLLRLKNGEKKMRRKDSRFLT